MIDVTFLMEQHIGHRAYYQNLRRFIDQAPVIRADWVPITYQDESSWWCRAPFFPSGLKGTLAGRSEARRGIKKQADALFFNTQVPAALSGGRIYQTPYVIATDITPLQYDRMGEAYGHQADGNGLISRYKHRVNRQIFQRAARLLPWSSWVGESLVADYGVDPSRVEVVSPGVDVDVWRPNSRGTRRPIRILFVGGDFYRKGGEILLKAFRSLPEGSAELVLVTRTKLKEEPGICIYNDIQPNSPELIDIYQTCDIFVLPTQAEAFGIAAVEASAVGLPVIATKVGGLAEIVVHGETGFLISKDETQTLVDHLCLLLDNPDLMREMGNGARERAVNRFNARKNAKRVVDILATLVEK